jgi:hypothetical protein
LPRTPKATNAVVEVELLYDRDRTTNRYYRMRGGRPEPMFDTGPSSGRGAFQRTCGGMSHAAVMRSVRRSSLPSVQPGLLGVDAVLDLRMGYTIGIPTHEPTEVIE